MKGLIAGPHDDDTRAVGPPSQPPPRTLEALPAGTLIGRYRVARQLGAGGMGRVYLATDPELAREVALKVVEVRESSDRAAAHARLLREAQALAQLSHPCVVTVYDAATYGANADAVYLAMEFVEGQDLRKWAAEVPRSWQETLAKLLRAGRGLEAAHQAGIVHRDFKPSNVMLGTDGRVRVLDFGLARGTSRWSADSGTDVGASGGSLEVELTQTGNVMGTPIYMAPEQFLGEPQDERTDQFSFCVSLYRLLFGAAPFPGESVSSLRRAVVSGKPPTRPADATSPRRLWQPILRGLSRHPDDRYPSMTLLLVDLEAASSRKRSVALVAGVLGVGAAAAVAGFVARSSDQKSCTGGSARASATWNSPRADELRSAFLRTEKPYAVAAAERAATTLDHYFDQYAAIHRDVCERGRAKDVAGGELDARFACLDRGLAEAAALVDVLVAGDDGVVARAPKSVLGLPSLDRCLVEAGTTAPPTPEQEEGEAALAKGRALWLSGRYADAMVTVEPHVVETSPRSVADPGLRGRLLVLHGELLQQLGKTDDAVASHEEARQLGASSGSDDLEFGALTGLVSVESARANHKRALEHARQAEALLTRIGRPRGAVARLSLLQGSVHMRLGEGEEAEEYLRAAIETTVGQPDLLLLRTAAIHNLATLHGSRGRYSEAHEALSEGLELVLKHLGPEHPTVGTYLGSRGVTLTRLGRFDEAQGDLERSLAIQIAAFGPEHPEVARTFQNLGVNQSGAGDVETALASYRKALRIKRKTLGENHPSVAFAANNVGDALVLLGRHDEAIEYLEEAARLWEIGGAPTSGSLVYPLAGLAEAHFARGDIKRAADYVARTLELLDEPAFDPYQAGRFLLVAARVAQASGDDASRIRELAILARDRLSGGERPAQQELDELDALLATLPHGRAGSSPAHSTPNEDVRD